MTRSSITQGAFASRTGQAIEEISGVTSQNSFLTHLKDHWLSSTLTILYGSIALIYSLEGFVIFMGLVAIVFSIQGENQAKRSRELKSLQETLREILQLLEDENLPNGKSRSKEAEESSGANPANPGDPPSAQP